jgi:myosin heavy subunit
VGEERVMNEADSPNHGDFVQPQDSNSLQPEQVSCPFYSVSKSENTVTAKLPLLAPAEKQQCQSQILSEENTPQQDWVADPDSEKQELVDAEFKKLLGLNEELRSANNDLYDKVEELKSALTESEMALQWQKKRSSVTESMLNQQAQELTASQEQVNSLFQQLETAVQTVQRQESLISNYKTQLEISQQRLAQLERECVLMKSSYNDQSHQLLQSESACRELRTRLMRQQRQTLQFKAALEKCLETPVPSYDCLENNDTSNSQTKPSRHSSVLFSQAQPIRPWSVEPESLTNIVDNANRATSASNINQWDNFTPNPSSTCDLDTEETPIQTQSVDTPEPEIETISSLGLTSLEEQLDGVIQMFFVANPPVSTSPEPPVEKDANSTQAGEAIWETSVIPLKDEPKITETLVTNDFLEETDDYWVNVGQSSSLELQKTADSPEPFTNQDTNAPSPLLYPQRPPKKRKSLASVELPNFQQKSH